MKLDKGLLVKEKSRETVEIKLTNNRLLNHHERELVSAMLMGTPYESLLENLLIYRVYEMQDGMGSLKFEGDKKDRTLGLSVAQVEYFDEDNVPVSIMINVDEEGEIYELDIWKIDFTPLKTFTHSSLIKLKTLERITKGFGK